MKKVLSNETIKYKSGKPVSIKGRRIEFWQSDYNPRDYDDITTMVCFHKRYVLGDPDTGYNKDDYDSWEELEDDIIKREKPIVIKPLYMYEHSKLYINTTGFSCSWDSGQIGFIFIPKKVAKENNLSRDECEKIINAKVLEYNKYVQGNIFGYSCYEDGELVDERDGFIGHDIMKNGMIDSMPEEFRNEFIDDLKTINIYDYI